MAIPKFREINYTDDGCSAYQCLSCKNQWEARTSPEYGWKFCPYCGVEWNGEVKGRPSHTPKWKWNLIDSLYGSDDYKIIQSRQNHIEENRNSVEANTLVWTIEYFEKDHWYCDDAFVNLRNTELPLHKAAYFRMLETRKRYEAEREENIRDYWGGDDDGEIVSTLGEEYLTEMCERMFPERQWRIRLLKKSEFRKFYPSKYVY